MAGPGGGPPRKSHTKSRKGCKTCKRRHIRCDELSPQCRNCTKHNCRCDFMDEPRLSDESPKSPPGPDLQWTPRIEAEIEVWQQTGVYPFPELHLNHYGQFNGLSKIDRRLIHHLSAVYRDLQRSGMVQCVPWVELLPLFLDNAADYDFVLSAILAFSATHLASVTHSTETRNLAYYHRGTALNGLHGAIGNFSEANSDPILAASILLSWQATDWGGWTSLMSGISTVASSMHPWRDDSRLAQYVEDHVIARPRSFVRIPMAPLNAPILPEDDRSLLDAISHLHNLRNFLAGNPTLSPYVEDILQSAEDIQVCYARLREEQLFERLASLRQRLLWLPISLMQGGPHADLNLLVIAYLYATALGIDASIPELNGAALGALTTASIEEITRQIRYAICPSDRQTLDSLKMEDMMQFPLQLSSRIRYDRSPSGQLSDVVLPGQQSPYGLQTLRIDSAPSTPGFPSTFPLYANISAEDLSIPPSPFLPNYHVSPTSRPHSQLIEHSPRPGSFSFERSPRPSSFSYEHSSSRPSSTSYEHSPRPGSMTFEHRPFSGLGPRGGSPAYSPAYSPGPPFLDDEQIFGLGETSSTAGRISGFETPTVWA